MSSANIVILIKNQIVLKNHRSIVEFNKSFKTKSSYFQKKSRKPEFLRRYINIFRTFPHINNPLFGDDNGRGSHLMAMWTTHSVLHGSCDTHGPITCFLQGVPK